MSRTRTRMVLGLGVVAAAAVWTVMPAAHAASGGTSVTFALSGGSLSISVPTSANIGSLTQGVLGTGNFTGSGSLGSTTVTDSRGGIAVTDTVVGTATTFAGAVSGNAGIPASDASLSSGVVTFSGGMVAVTGTPLTGTNLSGTGQQVMLGVTTGTGSASYNPTLSLTVPASSGIADTYTGTVTQTVS